MSAVVMRLPTAYVGQPMVQERPVSRKVIAGRFGVSVRTVDRWVERGMPQARQPDTGEGCWLQVGYHRRFYPSRVAAWITQQ